MRTASLHLDPAFIVGPVDPRLFGSFVEHMGRCVYTGIYEPDHPAADGEGFRQDVLDLVRELGATVVRYPGGNFVSGYRWEDGTGPREGRPVRLDLAWHSIERNQVGVDEFCQWARRAGTEPMLVVNLGTRGADAARNLVEYCNHLGGTAWSDLRACNGSPEPHGVRLWGLGNEMDGPWQIGHKTAAEYGRLAAETARVMRRADTRIELVACGSSGSAMPTFGSWESTVLEHTYDLVDYISLHSYYDREASDLDTYLASSLDMEAFIENVTAICDAVGARARSRRRVHLAFDEWNAWYQSRYRQQPDGPWMEAPRLIEDTYDQVDAVVVGSLLIALLRHADRVRIACQAQLANVIAPIRSEPGGPAWRQTIFHPFAQASRFGRGESLQVKVTSPAYDSERYGAVPYLAAAAVLDREGRNLTLFTVNRDREGALLVDADMRAWPGCRVLEHLTLCAGDPLAANDAEQPERVRPRSVAGARIEGGRLSAVLPPLSWNVVRLALPES